MNISKFTQKSLQAVQDLEKTAYDFGNQEIEQEHLLYNLLHQDDSLILKMIEKMEINKDHFLNRVETALNDRVKVSGGQPYIGQYLNKALINAEDEAKAMGDEYVSVEHLFLAMLKNPSPSMKKLFQGVRHHKRTFPAGIKHRARKPESYHRQPGGNIRHPGKIWPGYRRKSQKPENGPGYRP